MSEASITASPAPPLAPNVAQAEEGQAVAEGTEDGTETNGEAVEQVPWDKERQAFQQERATMRREHKEQMAKLESMAESLAKAPTAAVKEDRLAKIETFLKANGGAMDAMIPGFSEQWREFVEEVRESRGAGVEELKSEVQILREQRAFDEFFSDYPVTVKREFIKEQRRAQSEDELAGERLAGYMEGWLKNHMPAIGLAKPTNGAAPKASVIPAAGGARKAAAPDLLAELRAGKGGGNIGGVPNPFRK